MSRGTYGAPRVDAELRLGHRDRKVVDGQLLEAGSLLREDVLPVEASEALEDLRLHLQHAVAAASTASSCFSALVRSSLRSASKSSTRPPALTRLTDSQITRDSGNGPTLRQHVQGSRPELRRLRCSHLRAPLQDDHRFTLGVRESGSGPAAFNGPGKRLTLSH